MKSGKTRILFNYINNYIDINDIVIIVSFRKTFTSEFGVKYLKHLPNHNMESYIDIKGDISNRSVIIQYESLH